MIEKNSSPYSHAYSDRIALFLGNQEQLSSDPSSVSLAPRDILETIILYEAGYRQARIEMLEHANRDLRETVEKRTNQRDEARREAEHSDRYYGRMVDAERKLDRIKAAKRKQNKKGKK